ncbi:toll-like receptor 9 [Neocloeon triangulifer]|uniref:toll-like receptor 9 n=1 Tax=Neocloeon triangulifer TaxID=2078957 RepID=UPI00286F8171|nr:toll-like receptor 9 [Neocloeon triangulifer]
MTGRELLLFLVPLLFALSDGGQCPPSFQNKCWCGRMQYQGLSDMYVVNCTSQFFSDTHMLTALPPETQVLIFTGNHIPELPWNIFGTEDEMENLKVIDMSNNGIRSIRGKTYHRATKVERLILNYNEITLTEDGGHPRLLTGFPNLRELHLTAAFAAPDDKALPFEQLSALKKILETANLTQLVKIHLEQNQIASPLPSDFFCSLENLLDLHLGDNWLTDSSLPRISCLKRLRFIDLGRNRLRALSPQVTSDLEKLPERHQQLILDLGGNPLSCEDFCVGAFAHWLGATNVTVRNRDSLRCVNVGQVPCSKAVLDAARNNGGHSAAALVLGVLLAGLIVTLGVALYLNRNSLTYQLSPLVDTAGRKVRYTSIDKPEEQEMNV